MDTHVKVLGVLNIVLGALGALAGMVVLLVFGGIAGIVSTSANTQDALTAVPILGLVGAGVCILLLVLSLPAIIAGVGLLKYRRWGRILAIVLSALNLLNVPIGTALGVYGLWVLLNAETESLFEGPRPVPHSPSA